MRIDKFLNTTNILKRRNLAQDLIKNNLVSVNGVIVKASKEVKIGDMVEIKFLQYSKKYKILAIPQNKNIPKNAKNDFWEEM
mgnify:FL=1